MSTKVKIKIEDISYLRKDLDELYEHTEQVILARYALTLALHMLEFIGISNEDNEIIKSGIHTNKLWQTGKASVHEVRRAGFLIHELARDEDDTFKKLGYRVIGHAVATGHMREHAMVASDYAVKVINLKYPGDLEAIRLERTWQIETLKTCIKNRNK